MRARTASSSAGTAGRMRIVCRLRCPAGDLKVAPTRLACLQLSHLLRERGDDFLPVADDAEAGRLEDGRFGVLVDGDDVLHLGDAGHVLAGAGDADGDVQVARDYLAGQPALCRDAVPAP